MNNFFLITLQLLLIVFSNWSMQPEDQPGQHQDEKSEPELVHSYFKTIPQDVINIIARQIVDEGDPEKIENWVALAWDLKEGNALAKAMDTAYVEQRKERELIKSEFFQAINSRDLSRARNALAKGRWVIQSISVDGKTPLRIALDNRDVDMIKLLVDAGATPIQVTESNDYLISISPDIASKIDSARKRQEVLDNELIQAVISNELTVALNALKAGANPNASKYGLEGILHRAIIDYTLYENNLKLIGLLLAYGADPNNPEPGFGVPYRYPLLKAIGSNKPVLVDLLVASGADVNIQNQHGWTPLMYATAYNLTEVIDTLKAAGADPSIKNQEGKTASDYSKREADKK